LATNETPGEELRPPRAAAAPALHIDLAAAAEIAPITLTRLQRRRHVDLTRSKPAGGHLDTSVISFNLAAAAAETANPPRAAAAPHGSRARQYRRRSLGHLLRRRHRPDRQVSFPIS